MNELLRSQIDEKNKMLVAQHARVKTAQNEAREAKEESSRKRKVFEEENEKLLMMVQDLSDLMNGQQLLPFQRNGGDDPDDSVGATALGAVARLTKQGSGSGHPALQKNVSILIGYGVTESTISALMNSESSPVTTVGDLCRIMQSGESWHKQFKGLGDKKRQQIEEAVHKLLDDKPVKAREAELPDHRLRRCGNELCGAFREQDVEKCPACGDTIFELEEPPRDACREPSVFDAEMCEETEVPLGAGEGEIWLMTGQHPETGLWYGAGLFVNGDGSQQVGQEVPHQSLCPHESRQAAEVAAAEALAPELVAAGFSDQASRLVDWLSEMVPQDGTESMDPAVA